GSARGGACQMDKSGIEHQPQPVQPTTASPDTPSPPSHKPKWGDPLSNISPERQAELRQLAQAQQAWGGSAPDGHRHLSQSAFKGVELTGAEVFFLAVHVLAGPDGDLEATATRLRTAEKYGYTNQQVELSSLHLEGARLRLHPKRPSVIAMPISRSPE